MVATNEQQDRTTASPRSDGGYAPGVGRDGGSVGGDAGARMLAVALHLVRARSGMVALLDDAAGLRLLASSGGVTLDLGPDASMARAARTEEDVRIVPDAAAGGDRASELSDALAAHGFRFVAIVPLRFADGSARGLVWLADPEPRALDEDDVRCLRDVAALLDAHPTRAGAPARAAPSENGDDRSVATGERRFRALADIAPAILWLSDADGRLSFLSRGWHEATGQSEAESSGDGWLQALHPDDRDEVRNRFLNAHATHGSVAHAYRLRHQDDSYRWMHDAMRPRFLDDGTFAGYVGSVIDVHEHRLRTDVLRERERRLERMAAFRRSVLDLVEEGLSAPSAESLHQRVLEHAVQVIPGAEAGAILERVPDGDDFRFDAAVGYDLQRLRAVRIPASAVAFGEGMERRSPRIVPTPDVHPSVSPETAHILREYGRVGAIQAALVVPIVVDGRKVAHLTLDSFASADAFHDESVDMARIFAGQVAALFQRRALERELRRIAFEDPLTRLPNRAWFKDRLARTIGEVDGMTRRMAVVFVDLDNLKPVNDSLGHWAGDEVLRQVAARLRRCARPDDVLARLGGDEFTLMRVDPSVGREARALAERIVHAFREPIDLGDHRVAVTASIGIAVHPSDGADADDLLRHADIAMYHAKLRGKNAFAFFAAEMQAAPLERLMLEQALREALDRDEFVLEYQPRVDLRDGRIVAVEALVRWEHPTRGRVPPGAFMPLAETTALVHPLGRHILQMAARQAAAWRAEGFRDLRVAVNLSTRQVQHRDLVGEVREVLANAHLEADALEFEVLESAAMSDVTGSIATLQALKRLGARVALDDFGTGYSSLAYLRDLPIDALKIDRTFVARLGHAASRGNDLAIVRAIGSLGRELGLQVVAEGIERRAQVAMARDAGCTQAQGFLLSRPLPAAKVTPLLRAGRLQP